MILICAVVMSSKHCRSSTVLFDFEFEQLLNLKVFFFFDITGTSLYKNDLTFYLMEI